MAYDGNGNFIRLHNWTSDAANAININAGEMDGEDNGFAAGLSLAVTRDGQGKMSSDFLPNADNVLNLGTGGRRWSTLNSIPIASFLTLTTSTSNTTGADVATIFFQRQTSYSGGTAGFVNSCLKVETDVNGTAETAYEWAFLAKLVNNATAGQNVAGYFQGNRQTNTTGPTWGAVSEVIDHSGASNPTTGLVGLEVDCRASSTDTNFSRVGIDVVCTRFPVATGAAVNIGFGVRVQCGGDGANVTFGSGFTCFNITTAVAFDCSSSTVTSGALRMASGVPILFDAAGTNKVLFDSAFNGSVGGLAYSHSGTEVAAFGADGGLYFGTGGATFAALKGTTYASATAGSNGATPAQVAGYIQLVLTGTTCKIPYYNA